MQRYVYHYIYVLYIEITVQSLNVSCVLRGARLRLSVANRESGAVLIRFLRIRLASFVICAISLTSLRALTMRLSIGPSAYIRVSDSSELASLCRRDLNSQCDTNQFVSSGDPASAIPLAIH